MRAKSKDLRYLVGSLPAFALLIAAAIPSHAQNNQASPPAGRLLASNCFQCHSVTGRSSGFEDLRGKSSNEIYNDLIDFKSGKEGPGLMEKHALGYTDAQLRLIADYISTLR